MLIIDRSGNRLHGRGGAARRRCPYSHPHRSRSHPYFGGKGRFWYSCPRMVDRLHIKKILEMYVHNDETIRSKMIEVSNASGSFTSMGCQIRLKWPRLRALSQDADAESPFICESWWTQRMLIFVSDMIVAKVNGKIVALTSNYLVIENVVIA